VTSIDIGVLIAGIGAIIIGCYGKTFYYAKSRHASGGASDKKAPTWLGRLMFIGIGFLFLIFELKRAFFDLR
jgi:hypothetical protein